jgi:hypothetical protein
MALAYSRKPEKYRAASLKSYHKNREQNLIRQKNDRLKIRFEALAHYGGNPSKCACCGEMEERFLSIDHINGGGNIERKAGQGGGHFLYRRLRKLGYPEGFQVLCFNCNMAKGIDGQCPHQKRNQ